MNPNGYSADLATVSAVLANTKRRKTDSEDGGNKRHVTIILGYAVEGTLATVVSFVWQSALRHHKSLIPRHTPGIIGNGGGELKS